MECPICYERQAIYATPCSHFFCFICIREWIDKHRNCPMCRRSIEAVRVKFNSEKEVIEHECYLTVPPTTDLKKNMERLIEYVDFSIHELHQTLDSYTRLYYDRNEEYDEGEFGIITTISVKENGFLDTPIGTTTKRFLMLSFPELDIFNEKEECEEYYGATDLIVPVRNGTVTIGDVVGVCIRFFNSIPDRPELNQEWYPYSMYIFGLGFEHVKTTINFEVFSMLTTEM